MIIKAVPSSNQVCSLGGPPFQIGGIGRSVAFGCGKGGGNAPMKVSDRELFTGDSSSPAHSENKMALFLIGGQLWIDAGDF